MLSTMFELCQVVEGGLEPEKQAAVSLPATAPAAGRRERKMTYLVCAIISNFGHLGICHRPL